MTQKSLKLLNAKLSTLVKLRNIRNKNATIVENAYADDCLMACLEELIIKDKYPKETIINHIKKVVDCYYSLLNKKEYKEHRYNLINIEIKKEIPA